MGHTTLHAGAISFCGRRIEAMPPHERALAGLGYVPQEREIFPSLSVRENLEICARPGPWDSARVFELFPNLKSAARQRGHAALRRRAADAGDRARADDQSRRCC